MDGRDHDAIEAGLRAHRTRTARTWSSPRVETKGVTTCVTPSRHRHRAARRGPAYRRSCWPTSRPADFAPAAGRHPDRVLNVGIREQLMLGVAGGLALTGLRPDRALVRPVPGRPGVRADQAGPRPPGRRRGAGQRRRVVRRRRRRAAPTSHPGDVALLDTLDGWTVHVPGHPDEVAPLLRAAARHDDPGLPAAVRPGTTRRRTAGRAPADGRCAGLGRTRRSWSRSARCSTRCWRRPPAWTSPSPTPTRRGRSTRAGCGRSAGRDVVHGRAVPRGHLAPASSAEALAAPPHRRCTWASGATDLRRYGSPADHARWHGSGRGRPAPVGRGVSERLADRAGGAACGPARGPGSPAPRRRPSR